MNTTLIIGNLTRDAELRFTQKGDPVCNFTVAWNNWRKGDDQGHFFDCVLWGNPAQALAEKLKKGLKVGVTGELHQRRWNDKDGKSRESVEITVSEVDFMPIHKDEPDD
jgi:single-strand DNA-binding protein|tara:strand:+ start:1917 stop:2243 length:327 start_codon:yes stop_codon:yes gene_type:complete